MDNLSQRSMYWLAYFQTVIGTGYPDPHVPVEKVNATEDILIKMNADVTKKIYKNMGHTISQDEINQANKIIFD